MTNYEWALLLAHLGASTAQTRTQMAGAQSTLAGANAAAAADYQNRMEEAEEKEKKVGKWGSVGGAVGGILGAPFGPVGSFVGSTLGSTAGQQAAGARGNIFESVARNAANSAVSTLLAMGLDKGIGAVRGLTAADGAASLQMPDADKAYYDAFSGTQGGVSGLDQAAQDATKGLKLQGTEAPFPGAGQSAGQSGQMSYTPENDLVIDPITGKATYKQATNNNAMSAAAAAPTLTAPGGAPVPVAPGAPPIPAAPGPTNVGVPPVQGPAPLTPAEASARAEVQRQAGAAQNAQASVTMQRADEVMAEMQNMGLQLPASPAASAQAPQLGYNPTGYYDTATGQVIPASGVPPAEASRMNQEFATWKLRNRMASEGWAYGEGVSSEQPRMVPITDAQYDVAPEATTAPPVASTREAAGPGRLQQNIQAPFPEAAIVAPTASPQEPGYWAQVGDALRNQLPAEAERLGVGVRDLLYLAPEIDRPDIPIGLDPNIVSDIQRRMAEREEREQMLGIQQQRLGLEEQRVGLEGERLRQQESQFTRRLSQERTLEAERFTDRMAELKERARIAREQGNENAARDFENEMALMRERYRLIGELGYGGGGEGGNVGLGDMADRMLFDVGGVIPGADGTYYRVGEGGKVQTFGSQEEAMNAVFGGGGGGGAGGGGVVMKPPVEAGGGERRDVRWESDLGKDASISDKAGAAIGRLSQNLLNDLERFKVVLGRQTPEIFQDMETGEYIRYPASEAERKKRTNEWIAWMESGADPKNRPPLAPMVPQQRREQWKALSDWWDRYWEMY